MQKKQYYYFALAALSLAACTNSDDYFYDEQGKLSDAVSFQVLGKNATRAMLHQEGHYNFGVFGYKSSDLVNPIMADYLVGYQDNNKGYEQTGSTFGDQGGVADGKSHWMYEGMGSAQYYGTYAGGAMERFYQSNNPNQYLKYWDKSAEYTCFYAYAPYVGTEEAESAKRITYVDGTAQGTSNDKYVLTIPNGTLQAGYDDASKYEFMYAATQVKSADYGHDVTLNFKRLVAKVNIKFWEDVPGYRVRILDLQQGTYEGVQATPSIKDGTSNNYGYRYGTYYTSNGAKIKFDPTAATPNMGGTVQQFNGERVYDATGHKANLVFKAPTVQQIGDNRYTAVLSPTTYYAIPKEDGSNVLRSDNADFDDTMAAEADLAKTGFTFHVTYELTAEDTGEHIVVKNATVHVGKDYCNWQANTHYTYIFKITTNSNGSTEKDPTINPDDPEVPTTQSLYPIVFDNCTVADWDENESEWNVTDGTQLSYHNITLNTYSVATGAETNITVTIADSDKHDGHAINYAAVSVYGPNDESTDKSSWYSSDTHVITVPTGAPAGLYTVKYTCPGTDINGNHPTEWKVYFVVGNVYTVDTHKAVIGCNATEPEAKLNITATKDGNLYAMTDAILSIEYPANFTSEQKSNVSVSGTQVVVKQAATPGVYKLVMSINEGTTVKVAEKTFTVKDFTFDFNPRIVKKGENTTITCSQAADGDHVYSSDLVGAEVNNNKITIEAADVESVDDSTTQTITYKVYADGDDAQTTYTKTFTVVNSHSVSLNTNSIDRNVGTHNDTDFSTDYITITATFNGGVPESNLYTDGKLTIVNANKVDLDPAVAANFQITQDGAYNKYKLECQQATPAGNYFVKYTSTVKGEEVAKYAGFVVVE
ncbi:MAG: hypothetical protein ACI36X_04025 [Bacteroidaceae bacterium]